MCFSFTFFVQLPAGSCVFYFRFNVSTERFASLILEYVRCLVWPPWGSLNSGERRCQPCRHLVTFSFNLTNWYLLVTSFIVHLMWEMVSIIIMQCLWVLLTKYNICYARVRWRKTNSSKCVRKMLNYLLKIKKIIM